MLLRNQGKYMQAIDYYYKCMSINLESNDREGVARTSVNLSNIYLDLKEYDLALKNLRNAEHFFINSDDVRAYGLILINLGIAYFHKEQYAKAETYFRKSVEINSQFNNTFFLANTFYMLGEINRINKKDRLAFQSYNQALALLRQSKVSSILEAEILISKGLLITENDSISKGVNLITQAVEKAQEYEDPYVVQKGYHSLYELYKLNNDNKNALFSLEHYLVVKDSLYGPQSLYDFTSHKKNIENIRLKNENEAIKIDYQQFKVRHSRMVLYLSISIACFAICTSLVIYLFICLGKKNEEIHRLKSENTIMKKSRPYFQDNVLKFKLSN
jgi:tetratricopeptide (TPR) repeat protein